MKPLFTLWHNLSTKLMVNYTLWYGSLLGQSRNGSYIPYDTDIDVLIDISYVRRFYEYLTSRGPKYKWSGKRVTLMIQPDFHLPVTSRRHFNCKFEVVSSDIDQCSFRIPCLRLFIDEYHIDVFCAQMSEEWINDPDKDISYHRRTIWPFVNCKFLDIDTWCVWDPGSVLFQYYGNYLIPSKKCLSKQWVDNS
ncbi:hypothetical protein RF11_05539 [Thelohanellus kitauei]|uniref:LicD/FKTN/FKRP nucleotidyltransferase domain-containing protein n=1 Tax=Thelohanellus kitauei TaxID=669202 RepID=A0A0C2JWT0_THEKT|nr:hypothetical protein RF11_05539 [Thelohanellus kitauei]